MTRIALVHAVASAMPPVEGAFRKHWRKAQRTNILDNSLSADREKAGRLTDELSERIMLLARYAVACGAEGVLFTCSAFGPAIEKAAAALPVAVLKPNEAMFEAALKIGGRMALLATFAPAIASMEEEFRLLAASCGVSTILDLFVVAGAWDALAAGDRETHERLIAEEAARRTRYDAIMLAQFSMADAAARSQSSAGRLVLSAPESAVLKLRSCLLAPNQR